MIVKYYGSSIPNTKTYDVFRHISGYLEMDISYHRNNHRNNPSYCVWIVPGTVDMDGNDTGIE